VNFFFDNMMSPKLARMIAVLYEGVHRISHMREDPRFSQNSPDDVWIPTLANDDVPWSVISGDINMLRNPTIIASLHQSNIVFFCMDDNWCSRNNNNAEAWKLLKLWPEIETRAQGVSPAFYEIQTGERPRIDELKASKRARRRRLGH
jgi:hypothetical protein